MEDMVHVAQPARRQLNSYTEENMLIAMNNSIKEALQILGSTFTTQSIYDIRNKYKKNLKKANRNAIEPTLGLEAPKTEKRAYTRKERIPNNTIATESKKSVNFIVNGMQLSFKNSVKSIIFSKEGIEIDM